jgi:hypothetical protein
MSAKCEIARTFNARASLQNGGGGRSPVICRLLELWDGLALLELKNDRCRRRDCRFPFNVGDAAGPKITDSNVGIGLRLFKKPRSIHRHFLHVAIRPHLAVNENLELSADHCPKPSPESQAPVYRFSRAVDCGADLIVMGAYGQSRTHELIFGSCTEAFLRDADRPILLMH